MSFISIDLLLMRRSGRWALPGFVVGTIPQYKKKNQAGKFKVVAACTERWMYRTQKKGVAIGMWEW